jgi:hypothetical protein
MRGGIELSEMRGMQETRPDPAVSGSSEAAEKIRSIELFYVFILYLFYLCI